MRNEDKVLLMASIMGVDTSLYIPAYIEDLRNSQIYLLLAKKIQSLRKNKDFRSVDLVIRFEQLNLENIKSFEDYFNSYSEILDILNNALEDKEINPLLNESDDPLGKVKILFDGKLTTLDDMILDERYTDEYKISTFKEVYLNYHKEVKKTLMRPFVEFLMMEEVIDKNIEEKSKMTLLLLATILGNAIIISLPLFPVDTFRMIYDGTLPSQPVLIYFYIIVGLLFILDAIMIFFFNVKCKDFRFFLRAYNGLKRNGNLEKKILKKEERFYGLILSHINEKKILTMKVKKVSIVNLEIKNLFYLVSIKEKLPYLTQKWTISYAFFSFNLIFYLALGGFIITILLFLGGHI